MTQSKQNNLLINLFGSYLFIIFAIILVGNELDRVQSYLVLFFFTFFSIFYLCAQFFRLFAVNILLVSIIGFVTKLIIGYIFFEFYLWPDYFSNQYSKISFDHWEYLFFWESVKAIADYRIEHGYFSIIGYSYFENLHVYQGKYLFLNYIMSNLFLSGNKNLLDFSIQNSLFSFYTAIIISLIGMRFNCTKKHIKIIFIISLFQPFSFISVMIWRDVVGQFFVILGVYLLLLLNNANIFKSILILLFSSISMGLLRPVYICIPFILYYYKFFTQGFKKNKEIIFFMLVTSIIIITFFNSEFQNFLKISYHSYVGELDVTKFLILLPINFIRNLIGPFPWLVWFNFDDGTIFLIGNYLQAVYVTVIFFFTIIYYKTSDIEIKFHLILISLIILLMAISVIGINNSYFSFCAALCLPIFIKRISLKKFYYTYFIFFCGFILLNIIYIALGFYGSNLAVYL